jgi:hypothetical protein
MERVLVTCAAVSYLEEGAETAIIHCEFKMSKHTLARALTPGVDTRRPLPSVVHDGLPPECCLLSVGKKLDARR